MFLNVCVFLTKRRNETKWNEISIYSVESCCNGIKNHII